MGSDDREPRSIRAQYLRLFLSVVGQAHAVAAQSIRFSGGESAQIDFVAADGSIAKSIKVKDEYLRPLYELASDRAFQWPDGIDLRSLFPPKKARRVVFCPGGNVRFMFDLSALQAGPAGATFSFDNFVRDKLADLFEQLDLTDTNRAALTAALKAKNGIIVTGAPLKPGNIEAAAAVLGCRPDAVYFPKLESDEAVRDAVQLSQSALVVVSMASDDAAQVLLEFTTRCRTAAGGLEAAAIERVHLAVVQRRVRRSCSACARPTLIDALTLDKLPALLRPRDTSSYMFGRGCDRCGHAAYRGTVSIESVLAVDAGLRKLMTEQAPAEKIVEYGYKAGMRALLEDGLAKIIAGTTSFEEIFAVAPRISAAFNSAILAAGSAKPIAAGKPAASLEGHDGGFHVDGGKQTTKVADHRTTVLVIEDDVTQREVLELVFRSAGYEVVGAENGKSGLDLLKSKPVDLVVCDLMMPIMNGEEVVKEIRTDGRLRHLPVLILTAAGNAETEFNLLSFGADDFCEKNIQRKILLKRAERLLERSKKRSTGGKNPLEHFLKD